MNVPSVLPQAVFGRAKDPSSLPHDLRLRALEWAVYFAANGSSSAAELARQLRANAAEVEEALGRLASRGLVEERELDASEYVRAIAATDRDEETSLREFLAGAMAPQTTPQTPPSQSTPLPARRPRRPAPQFAFKPLPFQRPNDAAKESQPMTRPRTLSLRALMSMIESNAGSREAGQLDIYRVFVRVDTSLLKRNGIDTLRFSEDRLVSDPDLEQAIVRSVKKTLGIECPPAVWVEAP